VFEKKLLANPRDRELRSLKDLPRQDRLPPAPELQGQSLHRTNSGFAMTKTATPMFAREAPQI
jgi:hypothetical protein